MAFIAVVALVVVAAPGLTGVRDQIQGFAGVLVGEPACEVPLRDGTTAQLSPDEAAALTTAVVTGAPAEAQPTGTADTQAAVTPADVELDRPEGLTCRISRASGLPAQDLTASGLTPRAQTVFDEVGAVFGPIPYGGFAPGGISTGHGARSAHYDGRAVDFFFRPVGDEQQRAYGWAVTNWLVANAERLEIAVIIFDDRIWSARRSAQGWRPYSNPTGATDPISRHLDHIHVDVIRGS